MEDAPVEEVVEETTAAEETPESEEVEAEGSEETPEEGAEPAEKPPEGPTREQFDAAKFKLTVNGKEVEVSGKDLAAAYQRGESGAAKLREAAEIRKSVEAKETQLRAVARELATPEGFYEMLLAMKGDPIEFLGKVATLAKEEAKLTPEQRELRELKNEKALTEKQRAEQERLAKEQAERESVEKAQDAYEDAFEDEMDALGIPEDEEIRDELLMQVGRKAFQAMEAGEDPYIDEIVKEVWDKYQARYQKLAPKAPPPAAAKPKIPGTRTPPKTPAAPKAPKAGERIVYKSGSSLEDLLKIVG